VVTQSTHGARHFRYLEDYACADASPLSLSMPLATPEHDGRRINPYLQGLLPDSVEVLERSAPLFRGSPRNPFGHRTTMGRDCAGAVQFVPEGCAPDALEGDSALEPLTRAQIGARIRQLQHEPSGWEVSGEHWSLAGAQSKFTLVAKDESWFEPQGSAAST